MLLCNLTIWKKKLGLEIIYFITYNCFKTHKQISKKSTIQVARFAHFRKVTFNHCHWGIKHDNAFKRLLLFSKKGSKEVLKSRMQQGDKFRH